MADDFNRMFSHLLGLVRGSDEFSALKDSLNQLVASEAKVAEATAKAYGENFVAFAASQPQEIGNSLRELLECGRRESVVLRDFHESLRSVPNCISELAKHRDRAQALTKACTSVQETAVASAEEYAKVQEALRIAESRNSGDVAKLQKQLQQVKGKSEADKQRADQLTASNLPEIDETKKKMLQVILDEAKKVAQKRSETCERLSEISREAASIVGNLREFEDPLIPKLRERLQRLECEIVD